MLGSLIRRRLPAVVMFVVVGVIGSWWPAVQASATTVATISSSVIPFATTNGDVITVLVLSVSGQPVVAFGGDFTQVTTTDGVVHAATNFAAVNELTGALVYAATGVSSTGYVRALAYQNGLLYVGGDFTSFSGVSRSYLLALALPGWTVSSWNPGATASIAAIAVDSTAVYLGGATGTVKARSLTTGATIWSDPVVNGGVREMLINPLTGGLYVAGFFDTVDGFTNHGLIEVNKATGVPITTFAPVLQPNSGTGCCPTWDGEDPISIALDTNVSPAELVMGSGGHLNYVRMLNSTTGANIWDRFLSGDGQAVAVVGDSVLIGYHRNRPNTGSFDWPYYAAQLQTSNGALQAWQAGISTMPASVTDGDNNGVRSFAYDPTTNILVVGGAFTKYGASCNTPLTIVCTGGTKLNSLAAYQVTGVATAPPGQVTGLNATAVSTTEIDLAWTATSGATGYEVDRSSTSASSGFTPLAAGLSSASFADTTASPQTTYWYRVIASNSTGPGPASVVVSATTPAISPALLSNGFEGGSNGAAITAANSGGASGNAFNVVSCTSGTATYTTSADHGVRAAAFTPTTAACFLQWGTSSIPNSTTSYGRMDVNFSGVTGPTVLLAKLANSAAARDAQIDVSSTGKLAIYDANGTQKLAFTTTVPTGSWVRIEWTLVNSTTAGSLTLSMYSGDSLTPIETHTVTGMNTGASFGALQLGSVVTTTTAPAPFRIDDVAYGTVGPLGPAH